MQCETIVQRVYVEGLAEFWPNNVVQVELIGTKTVRVEWLTFKLVRQTDDESFFVKEHFADEYFCCYPLVPAGR